MYKYKKLKKNIPTLNRILSAIDYNKETGLLHWKVSSKRKRAGSQAGCVNNKGYIQVRIDNVDLFAHRIAWYVEFGEWPNIIDHINGIKTDNRISNLRNVSARENLLNKEINRNGKLPGAIKLSKNRWIAQAYVKNRRTVIGSFSSEKDAHLAYMNFISNLLDL